MMADLNEGRAHMIRPKYQLPTVASVTPQNIGPTWPLNVKDQRGLLAKF